MSPERRIQFAELVSTVLGPVPMGVVLGLAVGVHSGRGPIAGAGWGLLSVACAAVLPAVATAPLRHREARTPKVRLTYMAPAVGGALIGLAILLLLPAPRDVRVLALGFAAGLICSLAVNMIYPSSNHVAASAGGVLLAAGLLSGWAIALCTAVLLLAWSRVVMRAHTWPQTLVGAAIGATSASITILIAELR